MVQSEPLNAIWVEVCGCGVRGRLTGPAGSSWALHPASGHLSSICSRVFPQGLPEEFALVLTLLLKKHTYQSTWYLFQVMDGDGYPQVSPAQLPYWLMLPRAPGEAGPFLLLSQLVISRASPLHPRTQTQGYPSPSVPVPFFQVVFISNQLSSLSGTQFPLQ